MACLMLSGVGFPTVLRLGVAGCHNTSETNGNEEGFGKHFGYFKDKRSLAFKFRKGLILMGALPYLLGIWAVLAPTVSVCTIITFHRTFAVPLAAPC